MVRMIPAYAREVANTSERRVFNARKRIQGHDDRATIHSLGIGRHASAFQGGADFIVLAQGRRILVLEVKSPALSGTTRWRSAFKFKGLDADAAVPIDLGADTTGFVATQGPDRNDLLYVALTRTKYRGVILEPGRAE